MLMDEKINAASRIAGHGFGQPHVLRTALTHSSFLHENPHHDTPSNERLEFLGDAVLQLLVTEELFGLHPDLPEGQLSKLRSHVVNEGSLARLARKAGLQECLLVGKGESQHCDRDGLLADGLEALLGALYLDGGLPIARAAWQRWHDGENLYDPRHLDEFDAKSRLQEFSLKSWQSLPVYDTQETRREREAWFRVTLTLNDIPLLSTEGPSKRKAELWLAQACLRHGLHQGV